MDLDTAVDGGVKLALLEILPQKWGAETVKWMTQKQVSPLTKLCKNRFQIANNW